jgi:hypothetical protein
MPEPKPKPKPKPRPPDVLGRLVERVPLVKVLPALTPTRH